MAERPAGLGLPRGPGARQTVLAVGLVRARLLRRCAPRNDKPFIVIASAAKQSRDGFAPQPSAAAMRLRASSRSGALLAEATSPNREPRVTARAARAASFSLIFAMIASLARSKTARSVATKCCDWRRPARYPLISGTT